MPSFHSQSSGTNSYQRTCRLEQFPRRRYPSNYQILIFALFHRPSTAVMPSSTPVLHFRSQHPPPHPSPSPVPLTRPPHPSSSPVPLTRPPCPVSRLITRETRLSVISWDDCGFQWMPAAHSIEIKQPLLIAYVDSFTDDSAAILVLVNT